MKYLAIAVLLLAPVVRADSFGVTAITQELKADCPVPFRYGVATDLAENLLDAQASASYAGAVSLELSIEAVLRAISIDGTAYVGWASTDPITWLQSGIAIDPNASISITPDALWFGEQPVATPEPDTWILIIIALVIGLSCGWLWLRRAKPAPPVIMTEYGPVTESARRQAAMNMLADEELRGRVFEVVLRECGGDVSKGTAEFYRRYPELQHNVLWEPR